MRAWFAAMAVLCWAGTASGETFSSGRPSMGTVLEITVVTDDEAKAHAAFAACFARAEALEAAFTTWRDDSPLRALNRAAGGDEVAVPANVVRSSRGTSARSTTPS